MKNNLPKWPPRWPWLLLVGLVLGACQRDAGSGCRPDPAADAPAAAVPLKRLERPFFQLQTPAQTGQFLQTYPRFARLYLQRQPATAAALAQGLASMATNAELQQLAKTTAAAFPDSAALRRDLAAMFGRVQYHFPDFRVPPTYTYVSGLLGKDIFVNDSLLVLSLDWFAGPQARYRPDLPDYILRRYTPAHLLPQLAQNVASKYNRNHSQLTPTTTLDAMLSSGKVLYFASQMLPCTPDSLLLGYTRKEMLGLEANEARVWGHFLEKDLLYSTTPFLVQKYVGERPNVPEIDATCPGRVGQWVGLQIVRKYMAEHPDVKLAQLMAEKDAQKLLTQSRYRPKR